jgi:ring-1,2-phenylacetyl-CoA epoxidase subunit PaaD
MVSAPALRVVAADGVRRAWEVLAHVMDPEIPVLSIVDLGIVRTVDEDLDGALRVGLTPTYSGCPATEVIRGSVIDALARAGFRRTTVCEALSPPWTTDWITEEGRRKLREYGIAPPTPRATVVACPRCASRATEKLSEFGSTPCKALYRCTSCLEPFDSFKCI